jgi:hypothetical protein
VVGAGWAVRQPSSRALRLTPCGEAELGSLGIALTDTSLVRRAGPARAENHIRGNPDLNDTLARLQAFEARPEELAAGARPRPRTQQPAELKGGGVPPARGRA